MAETTYDLVFRAELLPDAEPAHVRSALATALKLDDARLAQLFGGGTVFVRRGADRDTAARFQALFKQAGARLRVMPVEESPAASAPVAPEPAATRAVRKQTLAERIAAQQGPATDAEPPRSIPTNSVPAAAAAFAAAETESVAPSFTLAPLGADLLDEDEREVKAEVLVGIEHIDLAPAGGVIPVLAPRADIIAAVAAPDLDVAQPGELLGEPIEFVPLPLDLSALSIAAPGAQLGTSKPAEPVQIRVDHLTVAPAGADLRGRPGS